MDECKSFESGKKRFLEYYGKINLGLLLAFMGMTGKEFYDYIIEPKYDISFDEFKELLRREKECKF